ncbi:hypothetical protein ACLMJK_006411 [Lecanora helva]
MAIPEGASIALIIVGAIIAFTLLVLLLLWAQESHENREPPGRWYRYRPRRYEQASGYSGDTPNKGKGRVGRDQKPSESSKEAVSQPQRAAKQDQRDSGQGGGGHKQAKGKINKGQAASNPNGRDSTSRRGTSEQTKKTPGVAARKNPSDHGTNGFEHGRLGSRGFRRFPFD